MTVLEADPPSPDTVSAFGLSIDTSSVTFTDTGDGVNYSTSGTVDVTFASENISVVLETADGDDGLVVDDSGNLVSLAAQVQANFEILGASFVVDTDNPLTLLYDSVDSEHVLYGSALLNFHNGSSTDALSVVLGASPDDPGLTINSGGIEQFSFGLQDDLTYDGVSIEIGSAASAFTFAYDSGSATYESFGDVSISYDGTDSTFTATLGDLDNPGLVLSSNASSELILESLNATISGSFDIDSLSFEIADGDPLTFVYTADDDYFEMNGTVTVSIDENMISATFGYDVTDDDNNTTSFPGMQIQDGDLIGVDFLITDSFSIAGVTMETTENGIGFSHTGLEDFYYAFGGIQIGFGDENVEFDAGTFASPGIVLNADSTSNSLDLEFLLVSLSGNLNFYGIEFVPDDVTFGFDKKDGDASNLFTFYGDVTVGVDGVDVSAFLGTKDSPGFSFADGDLVNLDVGISESISLSGLTVETTGDYLGVSYNATDDVFELFGGLSVTFEGQTLGVQAGTTGAPGMELIGDSSSHFVLQSLDATLTADFSLYGIDISLGDDGVTFIYDSTEDLYEVYGDVDIVIEGESIEAFLGDADTPGFQIVDGAVASVDIGVSTDVSLGGFEFKSPEDNPLTITYTSDNTTYTVFGEAELDTLWDVIVTLGDADNPGIEIIDNKWVIDDLEIEVDRINLGFAQIQEVDVAYSRDADTNDILVDIVFDVIIPELEGEIDTMVTTDNGKITSIYLEYTAVGTSEGIEVLDTGVDVAELGVYLQNLDQPADLQVTGDIGLEFGGQIGIGGDTVTLAYMEGEVYIDRKKLSMTDSVYFGGYQDGDDWKALIFEGDGEILIDWADNIYSLSSDLYLPTDYGIKITDELLITSEFIVLEADAEVRVPDGIPLIGGDDLGDIGFELLIDMENGAKSFAAAWVDVNLFGDKEQAGIKYNFDGGDISYIGSGDIADLTNEIENIEETIENEGITYAQQSFTFDFTGSSSFLADMSWYLDDGSGTQKDISEMKITMTGKIRDLIENETLENQPLSMKVVELQDGSYTTVDLGNTNGSLVLDFKNSMGGKVSSQGFIEQNIGLGGTIISELLPGTVVITYQYPESLELGANVVINTPSITNYYDYGDPSISMGTVSSGAGGTTIDSIFGGSIRLAAPSTLMAGDIINFQLQATTEGFQSDTVIDIYADNDKSGKDGTPIITGLLFNDGESFSSLSVISADWTVENINQVNGDSLYFYARLNNQNQRIVYSGYSPEYTIDSPVYGIVYDNDESNVLSGFRVFLDTDDDGQYTAGVDTTTTTDSDGNYVFDGVTDGSVTVGVIVPQGYASNETNEDIVTTTYLSGDSIEVNFDVNLLNSISGTVFEDTNGDGILDDTESGIQGVTLYLDLDSDGSYDSDVDVQTVTDSDGFWRFYNVAVNSSYDVYVLAYPSQISASDQDFITVDTTTVTVPDEDEAATLSPANTSISFAVTQDTQTTKYTHFNDNNIGIVSGAVSQVSDQSYMRYILSYFPDDDSSFTMPSLDPDNDGLSNKVEQLLNTHPNIANSSPRPVISVGQNNGSGNADVILIEYEQVAGNKYTTQASSDLQSWSSIDSYRALTSEPVILEIVVEPDEDETFFRILITE